LPAKGHQSDDGEDEDINALIEDLESDDEGADIEEEEEVAAGAARNIPEELLMTSASIGLTTEEVLARRKKFGLNQMKGM
jgi:H+-transporting ATPase